jgi:hypothetical protein
MIDKIKSNRYMEFDIEIPDIFLLKAVKTKLSGKFPDYFFIFNR